MAVERKIATYGWTPDLPDHRDRIFNLEERIEKGSALPQKVSLRSEEPPIYDQGQLGSCTGNAIGFAVEHQQLVQKETSGTPSRLFIYYEERVIEGTVSQDAGAQIRDGIKVVATKGAPLETDWAYDISKFDQRPPQQAYTDAVKHQALKYQSIVVGQPGAPMRTAIANHRPIVFGFSVPDTFEDPNWDPAKTPLSIPGPNNQIVGGHAVAVVGYDFSLSRFSVPVFEVRNSWGESWGDQGHFFMDYHWFDPYRGLASDLWVITLES